MATITISNTGGNWNAAGTWVGGIVPVTADTVVATATSGPVNVTVAASISILDLSLYTNTLTLTSSLSVGGTLSSGNALTLSGSMSIVSPTSAGILLIAGGSFCNLSLRSNGCVIPYFAIATQVTLRNATLLDNFTVTNFIQFVGNFSRVINGFQINVTNWIQDGGGGGSSGLINGTTKIYFNGANCTFNGTTGLTVNQIIGNPIYIDTPGNFTITGGLRTNPFGATTGIYYLQGTILGDKNLRISVPSTITGVNGIYEMDLNGSGTWNEIVINNSSNLTTTVRLLSNLNFSNLYFSNFQDSYLQGTLAARQPITFTGAGGLRGGGIYGGSVPFYVPLASGGNPLSYSAGVRLTPGPTHQVSFIGFVGGGTGNFSRCTFASATGGVQATLNLTGSQAVLYTNFTDINSSGGNTIYTFNGTLSNATNILTTNSLVPIRSTTFVN
jgi:hypothetical protein